MLFLKGATVYTFHFKKGFIFSSLNFNQNNLPLFSQWLLLSKNVITKGRVFYLSLTWKPVIANRNLSMVQTIHHAKVMSLFFISFTQSLFHTVMDDNRNFLFKPALKNDILKILYYFSMLAFSLFCTESQNGRWIILKSRLFVLWLHI